MKRSWVVLLWGALFNVLRCFAEAAYEETDLGTPKLEGIKGGFLESCDQIPLNESIATGTVEVVGDIVCEHPRLITVPAGKELTLLSSVDINLRNLHVVVEPTGTMSLRADRAISIERDEASKDLALIVLGGAVSFEAKGWIPRYMRGDMEDKHEVITATESGIIHSEQDLKYTEHSITVATVGEAQKAAVLKRKARNAMDQTSAPLSAELQDILHGVHANLARTEENVTPARREHEAATFSDKEASPPKNPTDIFAAQKSRGYPTNGADDSPRESDASWTTKRTRPSTSQTINRNSTWTDKRTTSSPIPAVAAAANSNDPPKPSQPEQSRSPSDFLHNRWMSEPKTVLKVGDVLEGLLMSTNGRARVWAGPDGSIQFGRAALAPPRAGGRSEPNGDYIKDDTAKSADASAVPSTVLIPSESRKVREVAKLRMRLKLAAATAKENIGKIAKKGRYARWKARRQRERAAKQEALVGQVQMSVTTRGCVQVKLDDTRVLSRSGPRKRDFLNRFPFKWRRPRSDRYEVHATQDGMEVRLEDKTIWSVWAADVKE